MVWELTCSYHCKEHTAAGFYTLVITCFTKLRLYCNEKGFISAVFFSLIFSTDKNTKWYFILYFLVLQCFPLLLLPFLYSCELIDQWANMTDSCWNCWPTVISSFPPALDMGWLRPKISSYSMSTRSLKLKPTWNKKNKLVRKTDSWRNHFSLLYQEP